MRLSELKKKLQAITKIQSGKEVLLRADRDVRYGAVMSAIATIKEAGIVRLGMITQPPADRG
jgi:biopolymer transport protein TolR